MTKRIALALALAAGLMGPAAAQASYTINGQAVDYQTQAMMAQAGLMPGHYWLMPNGNWGVMGSVQPFGNIYAGITQGPGALGGSGEIYGNGSWSYGGPYGPAGGVGGTADGCVYAGDWSNC